MGHMNWVQGAENEGAEACVFTNGDASGHPGTTAWGHWIDCNTKDQARLVAAAPAMLAFVERVATIRETAECSCEECLAGELDAFIEEAQTLFKKATGQ